MNLVMAGNGVHDAAQRVAAVEKRRRTLDDFQAIQTCRINRLSMIARLAGERSGSDAVLKHQHAVAVKASDDGPRRSRPEAPLRYAGLVFEDFAEGRRVVFGQIDRREGADALEGLKRGLFLSRGCDRHTLGKRGQAQIQVGDGCPVLFHFYLHWGRRHLMKVRPERVAAHRYLGEFVFPVFVGMDLPVQLGDFHRGAGHGLAAELVTGRALQISRGLCPGQGITGQEDGQPQGDSKTPQNITPKM